MDDQQGASAMGCLLGLLFLVALPVAYFTYGGFAPHLLLNPTTRYLYQFREIARPTEINLIPTLFPQGDTKQNVDTKLTEAGLERWSKRYGDVTNHQVFRLQAGNNWFCGYELFVVADYNDEDLLTSATAQQGGACL